MNQVSLCIHSFLTGGWVYIYLIWLHYLSRSSFTSCSLSDPFVQSVIPVGQCKDERVLHTLVFMFNLFLQYLLLVDLGFFNASSFILISATTRWWPDPVSLLRVTLMSWSELLRVSVMVTWSIWFLIIPSEDLHSRACEISYAGRFFPQWQAHLPRRNRRTVLYAHGSFTTLPYGRFPVPVVGAHLGVQIADTHGEICVEGGLKLGGRSLFSLNSSVPGA